ncbi:acetylxylan esterase [Candidatus Poribacteria bacterium]|nr:acetylxylan esterase [Candidatus Poribacteria bacterium]
MLSEIGLMILSSICVFSSQEESIINGWLEQPVLAPNEAHSEIQQFIKRRTTLLEFPETASEWRDKSENLRRELLEKVVFSGVPAEWIEGEPQVVFGDVIETDKGYLIRKLRYEALPGLWIPALLYEPTESKGKIPAVLNVNGHVGPPGKAIEYEQIRCINLAKRGMLALHPEWLFFGELAGEDYKHNRLAYLDLCGTSGLAVFYLAMKHGLDFLEKYPKTDPKRIAMTGLSGGGWQTIILSALDTRISLVVPNAGYICLFCRVDNVSDIGDLEQNPTDLVSIADYPCLTAMLAPRPTLLIYNEKDDCCFQSHRSRPAVFEPVTPFFELFDKADDFQFYNNIDPGTHNYEKDNREQFYRFINKYFLSPPFEIPPNPPLPKGGKRVISQSEKVDSEIPSDDEVLKQEELNVGLPENNANFFTLASELMEDLPVNRPPEGNPDELAKWQAEGRDRLRKVLRLKSMTAKASILKETSDGELKARYYKISIGEEWSVPAVAISKSEAIPGSIAIVLADKGKATVAETVEKLTENGSLVIAVDPLFMGECVPASSLWQYAQMVATVGERPLGIQVGQIGAIIEWVCKEYKTPCVRGARGGERVSLYSIGWNASIVALSACGLYGDKVQSVLLEDAPASLKLLIEKHLDYETYPALFCFGLLKQFDVQELIALCAPIKIELMQEEN